MRFTKVEGAGNDYVLVDGPVGDPAALSRAVSNRHLGVGSDGILLLSPGQGDAHAHMRIFNADGSEGLMCGNGLRCVIRWLAERRGLDQPELRVSTASGLRRGRRLPDGSVEVSMGEPCFAPGAVPVLVEPGAQGLASLPVPSGFCADPPLAYAASTGNPHLVVRVADLQGLDLAALGATLQADARLPEGANVHAVSLLAHDRLAARPFERGSGATQACGTGAVACAAVARHLGWCDADLITVVMPGDALTVRWPGHGEAWLGGPARLVFDGDWPGL